MIDSPDSKFVIYIPRLEMGKADINPADLSLCKYPNIAIAVIIENNATKEIEYVARGVMISIRGGGGCGKLVIIIS